MSMGAVWIVIRKDGKLKYFTETDFLVEYIKKFENEVRAIQNVKENEHDGD